MKQSQHVAGHAKHDPGIDTGEDRFNTYSG